MATETAVETNEQKAERGAARIYKDLATLVKAEGAAINDGGERAYRVANQDGGPTKYVVTNSPANAALAVMAVERVSQRELLEAALKAVVKGGV